MARWKEKKKGEQKEAVIKKMERWRKMERVKWEKAVMMEKQR